MANATHSIEYDSETNEPRVTRTVPRLTVDEMRDRVVKILAGELYPSDQVTDQNVLGIVFMPLAMGGLHPDDSLIERFLGSASAPERVEGDPEKPKHPGYPETRPEAPEHPELVRPDPTILSDVEWGDREQEEWEEHFKQVELENRKLLLAWEEETRKWGLATEEVNEAHALVDAAYEETLVGWREELVAHAERTAWRDASIQEWQDLYGRVFAGWASEVGVLLGDMRKAAPRSINGYPIFFGFEMIHREDWARMRKALVRECARSQTLEV